MIQVPMFEPQIRWTPPNDFPNLHKTANTISIDTETKDPLLLEKGPGTFRRDGYIVGISVATDCGFAGYYPVRHAAGGNLDRDTVFEWIREILSGNQLKVGAHLAYDLERLRGEGVQVAGRLYDVLVAEALLNENRDSYSLESVSHARLGKGKDEEALREAAKAYGLKHPKSEMWQLHAGHVGPYAEVDAINPLEIYQIQKQLLKDESLEQVMDLEMDLMRVLLDMRFLGVRVDLDKAEHVETLLKGKASASQNELNKIAGFPVDVWSGPSLTKMYKKLGYDYHLTTKGNPSFAKPLLEAQAAAGNNLAQLTLTTRKYSRAASAGVRKMIMENAVNGRIHPSFKQTRDDEGGTRSGRFACVNPNLQQVSARDPEIGPLVRGIFVPEEGHQWLAADYSQQEPRVTIHYAYLLGLDKAAEARQLYLDDPSTDYHQMVADMAYIRRKQAKPINLGLAYGMGIDKLARELGVSTEEARPIMAQYNKAVPFIQGLYDEAMRIADSRGYITTLLGRKCRFNLWEPVRQRGNDDNWKRPLPYEEAKAAYGAIKRAGTYKAMNRLVQGSSADMIKQAMVNCHKEGYLPHITVHDELGFSVPSQEVTNRIGEIMLHCVDITVPLKLDLEVGPSWGEAK